MRDALTDFLDRWEGERTRYGQQDCALWPAAWVQEVTGVDGGAPWRGRYSTEDECLALLEREGGLLAVMSQGARLVGLQPHLGHALPRRGDIGVVGVQVARGDPMVGAICLGLTWAALSERGVRYIRARPVATWSVPCPKLSG